MSCARSAGGCCRRRHRLAAAWPASSGSSSGSGGEAKAARRPPQSCIRPRAGPICLVACTSFERFSRIRGRGSARGGASRVTKFERPARTRPAGKSSLRAFCRYEGDLQSPRDSRAAPSAPPRQGHNPAQRESAPGGFYLNGTWMSRLLISLWDFSQAFQPSRKARVLTSLIINICRAIFSPIVQSRDTSRNGRSDRMTQKGLTHRCPYSYRRAVRNLGLGAHAPFLSVSSAAARPDAPFLSAEGVGYTSITHVGYKS